MKLVIWVTVSLIQIGFTKIDTLKPIENMAQTFHNSLIKILGPSELAWFHSALLFGEDQNIKQRPIIHSFILLGLYHLIVVSGSHLNFFTKTISKIFFFLPSKLKILTELFFIILFTLANRIQAACLRSLVFWIFKNMFSKKIRVEEDLQLVAIIFCLIIQPHLWNSLSFQLSCGASLALGIVSSLNLQNKTLNILLTPLFCVLITAPILLNVQPCLSWLVVPANILALPFVEASLLPLSSLSFLFPFLKKITEPLLFYLFRILDFVSQYSQPTLCFNQEGSRQWGLLYILCLLSFWRFLLPCLHRSLFRQSQRNPESSLDFGMSDKGTS